MSVVASALAVEKPGQSLVSCLELLVLRLVCASLGRLEGNQSARSLEFNILIKS